MTVGSGGMLVVFTVTVAVMINWCCPNHYGWKLQK